MSPTSCALLGVFSVMTVLWLRALVADMRDGHSIVFSAVGGISSAGGLFVTVGHALS